MLNKTAFCSIAYENYLPLVHTLAASLEEFHPELPFFTLLISEESPAEYAATDKLNILRVEDLAEPEINSSFAFYDPKQQSASLKPGLLKYLLHQGYATVIFLDPDMLLTSSLCEVIAIVSQHSLTLTPHILHPGEAAAFLNLEKVLLHCGMFNAGFIGVSSAPETFCFLDWWEKRLSEYCLNQPERGLHYDQRWLDHAPGFVSNLHVLRDPGVNAAYWNLLGRKIVFDGNDYQIDGVRLKCIHFSGFDPAQFPQATGYFPEIDIMQLGPLSELFSNYRQRLAAQGLLAKPCAAAGNNRLIRHDAGSFVSLLTDAEMKQLGHVAKVMKCQAGLQSALLFGNFIPVSAFSASGIKLRFGWCETEAWGVWSRGMYADLVLPVSESLHNGLKISLLMQAFVPKLHPRQEVNVFLNGELIEKWSFDWPNIPISQVIYVKADACANGVIVLGLQILDPVSPLSLGVSADSRVLGIGLRGLKVTPCSYCRYVDWNFNLGARLQKIVRKLIWRLSSTFNALKNGHQ
jgi:hypothetical protein